MSTRFPAVAASLTLQSAVNASLAELRGYMILGADAKKGEGFKARRADAWKTIDEHVAEIASLNPGATGLAGLQSTLAAFREIQKQIEDIAHASGNLPATRILSEQAAPRAAEMFALRYFEGLGNREIADLLGTSQGVVAVLLHRTRHRLRKELSILMGGTS